MSWLHQKSRSDGRRGMNCPRNLEQEGLISNLAFLPKYLKKVMDFLVVKEKECSGIEIYRRCF